MHMPCNHLPGFSYVEVAEFPTSGHLYDIPYLVFNNWKATDMWFCEGRHTSFICFPFRANGPECLIFSVTTKAVHRISLIQKSNQLIQLSFAWECVLAPRVSRRLSILYPGSRDLRTQLMTSVTYCVLWGHFPRVDDQELEAAEEPSLLAAMAWKGWIWSY